MFIKYIISTLVFLFLGNTVFAQSSNSILSTTVRKTASNGLNFTFFTKGENSEAPIVKDKGNNQYVILLPNLTDSTGKQPDFRTASDLVSDVNVKTINEGAVTYTKVTVTTKRPVSVKAETRKTSQSVSELSGVNDIVSKVNLINQDIQASKNIQPVSVAQKSPTLPKMNSVQDILNNKNLISAQKPEPVKPAVTVTPAPKSESLAAHVPANTKAIKNDTKKLQNENIKNIRQEAVKNIDKVEKNIKNAVADNILVNEEEPEVVLPPVNNEADSVKEIVPPKKGLNFGKIISSPIMLISLFLFGGLLLALFLFSKVKSALTDSEDINNSFIERMNTSIPSNKKDFSELAQNQNLNWQEKYASFKEGKAEEQQQELNSHIGAEPDEDLDIIEDYVEPEPEEVEIVPLMKNTPNPFASDYQNVHSSGDVIAHSMKRGVGLTSFDGLTRNMNALMDTVAQIEQEKPMVSAPVQPAIESPAPAPEIRANSTSPIQRAQAPAKKKMKIKESRAIDENKGFYLVDMDDKLALMGRINDKFTVLKKFDDKEKKTLQVRRDKDNLYMVRTDGFKALVDVDGSKMGVLAEL